MRQLLIGSICLTLFAISFSLVQISCSKAEAQNNQTQIQQINKLIYMEEFVAGNVIKFSIVNYDGTGLQNLNIPFPPGFFIQSNRPPRLSPDGTKVFFMGSETANNTFGIYSCDTTGANLIRIANCDPNAYEVALGGAY